ncbi:MAG: phosphatase PAP2 family protein, partial [Mogibacterium sp.]|nr:phosphatase PAP2 family protein [Mogibacterium sp.]
MDSFTQYDGNLLIGIQQALNADWLTPVMKVITLFGEYGIFWICCCLAMLLFKRTRRLGIMCSLALLFTFLVCNAGLKLLVGRTR